jgi:beta-glucosidase
VIPIVFVNADSGEGYIAIENNEGDRANLTLWKNGDDLIKNVSSLNPNTIVVIHSPGPVLVTDWYDSPNVTAILWAGLPGEESGNSIADILYGHVNPAGRSPFSWGPDRKSYGTDVLYKPNNGKGAPQDSFSEGVFIDYRHFDKVAPKSSDKGAPIYEFGFGLSYTTFEYSGLKIEKANAGEYVATTGETTEAPVLGEFSTDLNDYVFPKEQIRYIYQFIYPYINTSSSAKEASADPAYGKKAEEFLPAGATDGSPQPKLRSSGAPGGNPGLYDVLYTVSATITNTGKVAGEEVPQLYVGLGSDEPVKVLRGFDRIMVQPGGTATFTAELTRRDLSSWDVVSQDWVMSDAEKMVWVGGSSRNLPLSGKLS